MRIVADWISSHACQTVLTLFEQSGFQAFFVGGCVRNALLGTDISDVDVATSATPEQVVRIAQKAGIKAIPTGIDHGTVTLVVQDMPFEVTTFRRDVETDGRRAVVAFSTDVSDDARRRDFTMNALYATRHGDIVDPLGGLTDLEARRVRFIEDPETRIREDYLRILRFFRFHAWYGDKDQGIDADGLAACSSNLDGLASISRERVGHEFIKLLSAPDPSQALGAMEQTGVLASVLPGASTRAVFRVIHLEQGTVNPLLRLAVMGGEDTAELLRLSKAQARELTLIRDISGRPTDVLEVAYRHGVDIANAVALARAAVFEVPLQLPSGLAKASEQKFPIKAADLSLTGKDLGQELKRLEQIWIDSRFQISRDDLLTQARS